MKTINEQIVEIIISTVGVGLEGKYPYKIKLTNVDQAAKEIIALKQQAEKTPAQELSNNRLQSEDSANNLKTAEEILKGEMSENLWTFICSYPVSYKSEEKLVEWIIDAMQEYAAQFKAEKVTDETLKIELKKFNDWMCENQFDGRIPMIDQCIQEYMKYRSIHK